MVIRHTTVFIEHLLSMTVFVIDIETGTVPGEDLAIE